MNTPFDVVLSTSNLELFLGLSVPIPTLISPLPLLIKLIFLADPDTQSKFKLLFGPSKNI